MAGTRNTEIYLLTYSLTREFFRIKPNLPKNLRYDLGEMIGQSLLRVIKGLVVANGSRDKVRPLELVALEIESLWTFFRLLYDLRAISTGQFKVFSEMLFEVSTQNGKWLTWSRQKKKT